MGAFGAGIAEEAAGGHGYAGATYAGDQCQGLGEADEERVFEVHILEAVFGLGCAISEPEEDAEDKRCPGNDFNGEKPVGFDEVQGEAGDDNGDGADANIEDEACAFVVDLPGEGGFYAAQNGPDIAAEIEQDGEERADMDGDVKGFVILPVLRGFGV